ncbi:uncharacterized protein MONOS_12950 [Monocercomonoides exilis]|uniref:uncharacterized protein n=1 Tax=Monocercomonoides exilis TaxID=2049356 RepID=UPI00355A7476|nr:hypothetical protein MONOS_12950 [Monocercomonoides exilis]|eukprot:MONOS_12950.1-p1 / transcript=MONOS_12950.1 / gene=MONOS_12950 / organism=Monocercomonoides_exilis_PA203 / gene_product=unspecified product / transcript_product=unspecified product / location=Mono_scaffold00757:25964-26267(+) / protein_length=79 / sequence_SO=supercontig / SO=protein_coding / is_pseudo=false
MMIAVEMSVFDKIQSMRRQEVEMNENERKRDISLCRVAMELGERIHMESSQDEGIGEGIGDDIFRRKNRTFFNDENGI